MKQEARYLWQNYVGLPVTPRHWKLGWRKAGGPSMDWRDADEL